MMKTMNPYSTGTLFPSVKPSDSPIDCAPKSGYQFWGITLSNIPSSTTETQINDTFSKYGDIFSIKQVSNGSMNIIFKSPKKSTSIDDIISEQKKFKVSPLESANLPTKQSKSPVAKLSLLKSSNTTLKKPSKLSSSAPPFTMSPNRIVHTSKSSKSMSSRSKSTVPAVAEESNEEETQEGVFFEAVCKGISHGTSEAQVLDFIAEHIFGNIKREVVKDDMMMLPGESMAVFELNNTKAIRELTNIIDEQDSELKFNGHVFTLQRKSDGLDSSAKGLSLKLDVDEECEADAERSINSNGVNICVEDKQGVDILQGVGFDCGLPTQYKQHENFYFKLPADLKSVVAKQAETLGVPPTALVLILGVATANGGALPVTQYASLKKGEIARNLDALSDKTDTKSINRSQLDSAGSTVLFRDLSQQSSPVTDPKKRAYPIRAPLVDKGSLNKDKLKPNNATNPTTNPPNNNNNNNPKRMFQYPAAAALGTSSLFQNSSNTNILSNPINNNLTLISPRGVSLITMKPGANTILSPTASILSPRHKNLNLTGAPAPVVVPNAADFAPLKPSNVGNGFSMTTPISNLAPVHIPYLGTNNNASGGQSPLASGFQSPLNYNINTPQSPLANYSGITPIINAFTPTANGVSAITPTTSLPFYWSNMHNNSGSGNNSTANNPPPPPPPAPSTFPNTNTNTNNNNNNNVNNPIPLMSNNSSNNLMNNLNISGANNSQNPMGTNMDDPLAPSMNFLSNPSNNPYVQKALLRPPTAMPNTTATSPMNKAPPTFFRYPRPSDEPKSSPSNSGLLLPNGSMMPNNTFTMDNDMEKEDEDECQMDEPPSLDEINNMRNIPSVISPNGTTPVVMITNLNEDEIDCDKIFTLCGVFGDVQRVKISYHKRDTAFVQLANHRQAKHVVTSLNRMQLYGKMIHVNLSRMTRVKLPKDSPNSAMMFPDAKFLTKDYTASKKHRYSKKGAGGIKYSPLSIGQPSHILHIANLPIQSEAEELQKFLCGNDSFQGADKIQSIELIGVNNKLGSCQAFAKCSSVDVACQILIGYHSQEFLGREIKISFATRSHMPSDINKTHKTYSYSTTKKIGASINSIPTSIPRQSSNPIVDSTNAGDNMSSSSASSASTGYSAAAGLGIGVGSLANGYVRNNVSVNGNVGYMDANGQVTPFANGPRAYSGARNGYISYDNAMGYQTYDVVNSNGNKLQPPPDQDKIFVRQHHHSGGRKYHYKLRINK